MSISNLILAIYQVLTLLGSVALYPFFKLHRRGSKRLRERYGHWGLLRQKEYYWFHGASVGEINGLSPLIRKFKDRYPEAAILVTATSLTGLERAVGLADSAYLLPFDHKIYFKRAIANLRVRVFVLAETELWPNLINFLDQKQIPIFIVNAVISDFSVRAYRLLACLLSPLLKKIKLVTTAERLYAERLIELGLPTERIKLIANTKYDSEPSVQTEQQKTLVYKEFFAKRKAPILVLGSLRPGEEQFWFPVIQDLLREGGLNIIIAPRHQEKFDYFREQLNFAEIIFTNWSDLKTVHRNDSNYQVVLLDTMGKLEQVYSIAQLAFIGGSLVPGIGGHNPLEAAAYACPVVMGPHHQNVLGIVGQLKENEAIYIVNTELEIKKLVQELIEQKTSLIEVGKRGQQIWQKQHGASEQIFEVLIKNLA